MKTRIGRFSLWAFVCTLGFSLGFATNVFASSPSPTEFACKQCWYTPPEPPNTCSECHHNCLGGEYVCCGCPAEQ
jgi:hypothetical protein